MIIKTECTLCGEEIHQKIDLGVSPPANNFISRFNDPSQAYPLLVDFCQSCFSLQLRHCLDEKELYSNYTYLTPRTDSLTNHYQQITSYLLEKKFLGKKTNCLEIGSNNGQFLRFLKPYSNSVLGVDPAKNVAKIALESGIETISEFFSLEMCKEQGLRNRSINLVVARHMFAHNSQPSKLFSGINEVLTDDGIILIENAYGLDTLINGEFDQIYHEHMFYFTVKSIKNFLNLQGYDLNDLIFSKVHGGSIVFVASKAGSYNISKVIDKQIKVENKFFTADKIFNSFNLKIEEIKDKVLKEIYKDLEDNKTVVAYGATAKAFTMFSYLGLNSKEITFCADTSITKIGKYFPQSNIPIISEAEMQSSSFDSVLVTAWNYKKDIMNKSENIFGKDKKIIFPLPEFEIFLT